MVATGLTMTAPEPEATLPTPLSIDALVVLVVDQLRVEELPRFIVAGLDVSVPLGVPITVTVTCLVVVPVGPTNVNV